MARMPRYISPGHPHHIIQRGNNKQALFFCEDDYEFYLDCLYDALSRFGCQLHAYVLMTNHVHLLLTPETENGISKVMQSVGRRFVQYINYTYQRTGSLWEGKFKSTLIETERYLLICYRYIELNPVRAGLVRHPGEYRWSSFLHHADKCTNDFINDHEIYKRLGATEISRARVYSGLFEPEINEKCIDAIRESTNKGWVLGNERFKQEISIGRAHV